ncbi:MAG: T9SS type A sorting domain-containing protein, partial [Cryomorphaceae bacterium]
IDVEEFISPGGINSFISKFNDLPLSASTPETMGDLSLFPNPSVGEFMIHSARGLNHAQVQVYSMNGQSIPFERKQSEDRISISLEAPAGLYQVLINYPDGTATNRKVVIINR